MPATRPLGPSSSRSEPLGARAIAPIRPKPVNKAPQRAGLVAGWHPASFALADTDS